MTAVIRPPAAALRRPTDRLGLSLSTGAEAAALFDRAVDRLLALEVGAEELLARTLAVDPTFALGHAVAATVLRQRDAPSTDVWDHLNRARAHLGGVTEREAGFVTAAVLWCHRRLPAGRALLAHVDRWPRDAYALALLTPSIASSGIEDGAVDVWDLLDRVATQYPGADWWLDSIRAFARTEQHRFAEAEELALSALRVRPGAGHAAHAVAHVHYETGRWAEGIVWIDRWLAGPGAEQVFGGHFAWHAALDELRLGRRKAAADRFGTELAGLQGPRALLDGAALLVRGALLGRPVAGRSAADALDRAAGPIASQPLHPFAAWNAVLLAGLRGDRDRLAALQDQAAGRPDPAWAQVAAVAASVTCLLDGDPAAAIGHLEALGDTRPMGGSPAQRELLDDLADYCRLTAGAPPTLGAFGVDPDPIDRTLGPEPRTSLGGRPGPLTGSGP